MLKYSIVMPWEEDLFENRILKPVNHDSLPISFAEKEYI